MKTMKSKYAGYCNRCYFTIFKGENIHFNGKAFHVDCEVSLKDVYPRKLNPRYRYIYGSVKRKKMLELVEQKKALQEKLVLPV